MASSALDSRRATTLSQLFDELQNDFFLSSPLALSNPSASSLWKKLDMSVPAATSITVDVKETDKDYQVDAELPGMKKEDIKLSFTEGGNMVITAERQEEREEKPSAAAAPEGGADVAAAENKPIYYFKERSYGKVYRSFKLPPNADTTQVAAKLEDGVLKVTLPKRTAPSERTVEIK
jgi:HSP20 family protein